MNASNKHIRVKGVLAEGRCQACQASEGAETTNNKAGAYDATGGTLCTAVTRFRLFSRANSKAYLAIAVVACGTEHVHD